MCLPVPPLMAHACADTVHVLLPVLQNQIHMLSPQETGVQLGDSQAGFSKWSSVSTLERKDWVHRDA